MALTKNNIVEQITAELGSSRIKAVNMTETLLEIIKSTLESSEDVLVSGFGKLCVKENEFKKLISKIQIVGDETPYIAVDTTGNKFRYGDKVTYKGRKAFKASEWLGIEPYYYD